METIYLKIVVERDIPRLETELARRVYIAIENKLSSSPNTYGYHLHGTLKKYWKFRVGDHRVIYTLTREKIIIVAIGHRKEIYKLLENRI